MFGRHFLRGLNFLHHGQQCLWCFCVLLCVVCCACVIAPAAPSPAWRVETETSYYCDSHRLSELRPDLRGRMVCMAHDCDIINTFNATAVELARVWVNEQMKLHPDKGIFVDIVPSGPEVLELVIAPLRHLSFSPAVWKPKHLARIRVYGHLRGFNGPVYIDSTAAFTIIPYDMGKIAFQFTVGPGEFPVTTLGMGSAQGYMREVVVEMNANVIRRVQCIWLTKDSPFQGQEGALPGRTI